ncbi:MAG TPA: gliding motility-associated C-terminal domain-containing protein [Adhaeribacter sp.]|nr:gliding motility-associated C-terminal domain-containing protein [Adhaeribacter sp.]
MAYYPSFFNRCLVFLLILVPLSFPVQAGMTSPAAANPEKSLEFIQNRNQWDAAVKFRAALPGGQLYLKTSGFVYDFQDQEQMAHHDPHHASANQPASPLVRAHAYEVTFLNASPQTTLTGARKTPGFRNYFIGDNISKWASDVPAFEEVQYKQLYPGTEMRIYEHNRKLKYDFILEARANPKNIRMQYTGADKVYLQQGNLVIKTSVATITELKPYAYQLVKGRQQEVACNFKLHEGVVTFEFPKGYNRRIPLVIDPTLVFSTFSGSTADNWGFTATYDDAGNMYSGGVAFSFGFPTTIGAYQFSFQGRVDIAIIKYNPTTSGGNSRIYSTYLGGLAIEAPHSLVVNNQNELLILGTTASANYPTTSTAYDRTFNGGTRINPFTEPSGPFSDVSYFEYVPGSDLIISKLSPAGNQLRASTFLGGSGNDGLLRIGSPLSRNYGDQFRGDILTDATGNVYITSSTSSSNFPVPNGFQTTYGGGATDAVVCKLNSDLSSLLWSSFLGGSGHDAAYSVQVDNLFNVFICGGTTSNGLQQTNGAFKPAFTNGTDAVDGFASKISPTGQLIRTTYIGAASGYDQTYFLQLDALNNVYLLGQSAVNYPASPGVFNASPGRQFIHKLNSDLTGSIFSLNFGSGNFNPKYNISPTAFLVDNCERLFVCGWGGVINDPARHGGLNFYVGGGTTGLPVTANAVKQTTDDSDFYLMQLSQNGTTLDYATFIGGSGSSSNEHVDGGTSRFDKRGFVYQSLCGGCGGNNAFPTTPNAWSAINGSSNCNNAAFKFDFAVSSAIPGTDQVVCLDAGPFTIAGATPAGGVWSGTGVSATTGVFDPAQAGLGTHILTYTVTVGNCLSRATKAITVVAPPQVSFSGLNATYCLEDNTVTLVPSVSGGTFSGKGIQNQNQWSPQTAGPGAHIITYTFTDTSGCTALARDTAFVAIPPNINAGPDEGACAGADPFQLTGATPEGGTWSGPGVTPGGLFTPPNNLGPLELTYTIQDGSCTYTSRKKIVINPAPDVSLKLQFGNCGTDSVAAGFAPLKAEFTNNTALGLSFSWDFGDGTSSSERSPEHIYTRPGTYTITLTTDFGRGCIISSVVGRVTVIEPLLPNIITPNGDNLNDYFEPMVTCRPATLKIFSRWGNLVYEREGYGREFNGANLSGGIYYYFLKDTEGRSWKGWLEIIK